MRALASKASSNYPKYLPRDRQSFVTSISLLAGNAQAQQPPFQSQVQLRSHVPSGLVITTSLHLSPSLPPARLFHTTTSRLREHCSDSYKFVEQLKAQGLTEAQAEAALKIIDEACVEASSFLSRHTMTREDSAKATYAQKVDFAKLRSDLLSGDEKERIDSKGSFEKTEKDLLKLRQTLRDELARIEAGIRLDLSLEKGRIKGETHDQDMRINEISSKIYQEVAALQKELEQVKLQTLQWVVGSCAGITALLLGAWRLYM